MSDPTKVSRRLVAVFAADVEGYSRLMGADEVGTLKDLTERRAILDRFIGEHGGRIANTAGDSVLAEFGSAVDAVQCAVAAQDALAEANASLAPERRISFRIGVHIGDVIFHNGDLFGQGVNIVARLQQLARPGGVCVSSVTYNQVHKILPIAFSDLGAQQVKNIDEPIHAFETVSSDQRTERLIDFARHGFPPPLPDKPSIAVLPFQNMSGDPEQEYFADGVVEEITTALSRFKSLFVIARNSSFTYKGKAVDVRKVGQELGVRYVLEGSVRKGSGRIRVAAQLVEAASGAHLWADKFDATLEDVFETQDNLTLSVVAAIAPKILEIEARSVDRKRDLNSYDRYLRAMALHYRYTRASLREAYGEARKAIAANASFGVAYAQAASCPHNLKFNHGEQLTDAEFAEMISLITTALELANDDEGVLALAAEIFSMERQEYERGLALADRAIALNSNWTSAWTARGWCTLSLGQFAEAFESFAKGLRLNPIDRFPVYGPLRGLASTSAIARRYDEAMSWADKLLVLGQMILWRSR